MIKIIVGSGLAIYGSAPCNFQGHFPFLSLSQLEMAFQLLAIFHYLMVPKQSRVALSITLVRIHGAQLAWPMCIPIVTPIVVPQTCPKC